MMLLYQFPISHYCEKARWALDHKRISYKTINLIPGPHLFTTKRLSKKTYVPILLHDGKSVQGSGDIMTYLDEMGSSKRLVPQELHFQKEVLEWETYLDREVGVHLRRYFYHTLLEDRKLVTSLLLQQGPYYGPLLYFFIFPLIRKTMRKAMNINAESAKRSKERLEKAMERLNNVLVTKQFLVGDCFSRVDITAASLLAPLFQPKEHTYQWPKEMPESLAGFYHAHMRDPLCSWVLKMYNEYRR